MEDTIMKILRTALAALFFSSPLSPASAGNLPIGSVEMGHWYHCQELADIKLLTAEAEIAGGPASYVIWRKLASEGRCIQEPAPKAVKIVKLVEQVRTPTGETITIVEAESDGKPYYFITSSVPLQPGA
jgi:hypothetical protein